MKRFHAAGICDCNAPDEESLPAGWVIPPHARDWIKWLLDRDPEYARDLIHYYEREAEHRATINAPERSEDG